MRSRHYRKRPCHLRRKNSSRTREKEIITEARSLAGGLVVGVLPTSSAADANPCVAVPIATGMGDARNVIIANTAEAFVAVGGSYGTLSEIAFARKRGKPVVSLGSW